MEFEEIYQGLDKLRRDPATIADLERMVRDASTRLPWEKDAYGIQPCDHAQSIFRITSFEHLVCSLGTDTSYFGTPWGWEPLDSVFVKSILHNKMTGDLIDQSYKYDFFCQCWQSSGDQPHMWTRFSKLSGCDYNGVMIETNLKQFIESIYEEAGGQVFCGRVNYYDEQELLNPDLFYSGGDGGTHLFADSGRGMKSTLFLKLDEFIEENEIRFCIQNHDKGRAVETAVSQSKKPLGVHYRHKTEYRNLIRRVLVDPRMSDRKYAEVRETLESYDVKQVERSKAPVDFASATNTNIRQVPAISYFVDFGRLGT